MNPVQSFHFPKNTPFPNGIIGMLFLLATEIMFFGGLISAYIINRAGTGAWPPPGQPRLAVELTGVNTFFLLLSAATIYLVNSKLINKNLPAAKKLMVATIFLGLTFLFIQGSEWVKLLNFGLTTRSGLYGAFFYTIIGAHALHVLVGISVLFYLLFSFKSQPLEEISVRVKVGGLYWYFVVGIWPVLYYLVYLF